MINKYDDFDEDFQVAIKHSFEAASDYIDMDIAPEREKATDYYFARPFGNEIAGRSQFVLSEVRDTVNAITPSLMRVFTGSERSFQYTPRNPNSVEQAEQATDYARYILFDESSGYEILYSVIQDALIRKTGITKWSWEEIKEVKEYSYTSIDYMVAQAIIQEDDVVEAEQSIEWPEGFDPETADEMMLQLAMMEAKVSLKIKRVTTHGKPRIDAVPPEEFLIKRGTRSIKEADYVAQRSLVTASDLVAMGFDREIVEKHADDDLNLSNLNNELFNRDPATHRYGDNLETDDAMRSVLYVEHYIRYDLDDDGIAELHKVCTLGRECEVVYHEITDEAPYSIWCPYPQPHMVIGQSIADQVMDLQLLNSSILRSAVNSLALSTNPRMAYVEDRVHVEDLLNTEIGGLVRVKEQGAIQELTTTFVGQPAMQMLGYTDQVKAARTGISAASQGLTPEALQSSTASAVAAITDGASARLEIIARNLAQYGMKPLAAGLLRLICRNADKPTLMRLRGKFVEVDPRSWDATMDVTVDVGNGRGDDAARMQYLATILSKQEQLLQSPVGDMITSPSQYRHTLDLMLGLGGFKDSSQFFKSIPPDATLPKPPPAIDPNVAMAQAQVAKVNSDQQIAVMKLELERQKMYLEDEREREKYQSELFIKAMVEYAKHGLALDAAAFKQSMDMVRLASSQASGQLVQGTAQVADLPDPTPIDPQSLMAPPQPQFGPLPAQGDPRLNNPGALPDQRRIVQPVGVR